MRDRYFLASALVTIAVLSFSRPDALAATGRTVVVTAQSADKEDSEEADSPATREHQIIIKAVEPELAGARSKRSAAWLGVATEECGEALASQLGLKPGEGLLVNFVAKDSPAAKAGLQKNDVIAEFEGQMLVLPTQLRKLIQMRKEGDTVKLAVYRSGKRQDLTATVGKTTSGLFGEEFNGNIRVLKRQLQDLPLGAEDLDEQMKSLHESLAQAGLDKEKLHIEIQRSVEGARQAIQDALRQSTNARQALGPAARELREMARRGFNVDKDATVVVKSRQNAVKTIVKTDDSGTYVVVANPKKQLTAHDKAGKLSFDGPIETSEEQDKVPRDVWEKVQPMIDQLKQEKGDELRIEEEVTEEN
jgi:membrane-associated protease RseP (regulator of RpoE activity)